MLILRSSKLRPDQIVPNLGRVQPSQGRWRPPASASSHDVTADGEDATRVPHDEEPDRTRSSKSGAR